MKATTNFMTMAILCWGLSFSSSSCSTQDIDKTNDESLGDCRKLKQKLHYLFDDSVSVQLSYMAYACGDCFPQYRVDKVLSSEYNDKTYLYNKEIDVQFVGENLNQQIEELDKLGCSGTCYIYTLSGVLKRNGFGMFKLEAFDGQIDVDKDCCDEDK
jgi:hypothetical protein